jgi:hypothetical protein
MMPEEFDEVVEVVSIERSVFKMPEAIQLGRSGVKTEIVGTHIHFFHQLPGFIDDGGAVSPGEDSREKCCDLDVLFLAEKVWDGYGIIDNERLIDV